MMKQVSLYRFYCSCYLSIVIAIQQATKILKNTRDFVRPLVSTVPPFFSHSLAQSVAVFKKSTSSPLHFLTQKITALEKKVLAFIALPQLPQSVSPPTPKVNQPPVRISQAQAASTPLPAMLRLLHQFYKERAQLAVFEQLENAPRMIEKVLFTLGVLQGFMERKIGALEREDPIFSDSIQTY
jgi:hypothetical protein